MEEIVQVIKIGFLCVQHLPANRLKMSRVVNNKQVENVCKVAENVSTVAKSVTASCPSSTLNTTTFSSHVVKVAEEVDDSSLLSNMP